MVEFIQPPEPRTLLPPFLACLPAAFVSNRPPPALLPLLSPILRQRVQILSSTSSGSDSWLQLLSWDPTKAERLQSLLDGADFEPHPVSGEVELPDELPVEYKRIDQETLRSRVPLPDFNIAVLYVWCPTDQEGGGPGWRVAELLPWDGSAEDDKSWLLSIAEANEHAKEKVVQDALKQAEQVDQGLEDDDDDDYWAQYDNTPGRTPSIKTPAPNPVSSIHQPVASEASYFARYGDVQPAMDNDDPSEDKAEFGVSSLNGDTLASLLQRQVSHVGKDESPRVNGYAPGDARQEDIAMLLNHPRPSSTSSASSDAVAKLEQEAENQSSVETGVKQHISSNIKSLFRLAKTTGRVGSPPKGARASWLLLLPRSHAASNSDKGTGQIPHPFIPPAAGISFLVLLSFYYNALLLII
ncbi:hypothetical protein DTO166G4_3069 [Paecilomyces variotii]|nr:hypothetical protein DTO166G4_3069 [Paecilomyces variotii]KAJ9233396.1 hypothetical protein DTO166G5_5754 [Paecilomyces variotii]